MDNMTEMREEWEAWRLLCEELTRCSAAIDINEEPRLHAAIVQWGELLVRLRLTQSEEIRAEALMDAERKGRLAHR